MIPYDPRFLEFDRWAMFTQAQLLPFGFVPVETSEDDWEKWATAVIQVPAVAALQVPQPRMFNNWVDWAHRLNEGLRLI